MVTFGRAASQELRERVRTQLVEAEHALGDDPALARRGPRLRPDPAAARLRRRRTPGAAPAGARGAGRVRRGHDRDHPPVLLDGARLARRRRRHRLAGPAGRGPRRPDRRGGRRPLPPGVRLRRARPGLRPPGGDGDRPGRHRRSPGRARAGGRGPRRLRRDAGWRSPRPCARRWTGASAGSGSCPTTTCSVSSPTRSSTRTLPRGPGCGSAGRSCWSTSSRTPTRCSGRCSIARSPGHATMVLIGDPKQAIYAFRGGDVTTYLVGGGDRDHPADAGGQLAQRRRAARPRRSSCWPVPSWATSGSWSTTSRRTIRSGGWSVRRRTPRCGSGWSAANSSAGAASSTLTVGQIRPHISEDLALDVRRAAGLRCDVRRAADRARPTSRSSATGMPTWPRPAAPWPRWGCPP